MSPSTVTICMSEYEVGRCMQRTRQGTDTRRMKYTRVERRDFEIMYLRGKIDNNNYNNSK